MNRHLSLLFFTAALSSSIAQAADARWYRYYDNKKQANVTDSISPEHVTHGYDELTASMQVIKHIPPQRALTAQEVADIKIKNEADAKRVRDDKQLRRLYSSAAEAVSARDRQLNATQLRIDFSVSTLANLRKLRSTAVQKAAALERTGKPVHQEIKNDIAEYDKKILSAQLEINARKADQVRTHEEFDPLINRLQELLGTPSAVSAPKKL